MSQTESAGPEPLQFEKAEYAGKPGVEECSTCHQQMIDSYYRLNDRRICAPCAELAKTNQLKTDGNFFRSLFFGIGAAIAGLILYAAFAIATGWVIGYLSLAVGYIIAKAMMKGSGGVGGRKFQIAAVLLTYGAVSLAAIPVAIHGYSGKSGDGNSQVQTQPQPAGESQDPNKQAVASSQSEGGSGAGFLSAIGALLLIGLASPFLELSEGIHGILGLVILFVGLNIAWKTTEAAEFQLLGPFSLAKKES
jgi:hypothetical protein